MPPACQHRTIRINSGVTDIDADHVEGVSGKVFHMVPVVCKQSRYPLPYSQLQAICVGKKADEGSWFLSVPEGGRISFGACCRDGVMRSI